jgi:hypothetical protein
MLQSQPRQVVLEAISKNTHHKKAGGVAHGIGPEFKSQSCKKKKKNGFNFFKINLKYCWLLLSALL